MERRPRKNEAFLHIDIEPLLPARKAQRAVARQGVSM